MSRGTLYDVLSNKDENGDYLDIAKVLEKTTPIFRDAPMIEGTGTTTHKHAVQTGINEASTVQLGQYRDTGKSSARTFVSTIEKVGNAYKIPVDVLKLATNESEFLSRETDSMSMGLAQKFEEKVIYGSGAGEEMLGLAPRLNDVSNQMVVDAGDNTANLTSLYLVGWGYSDGTYIAYPKGDDNVGLSIEDLGVQTFNDTSEKYLQYRILQGDMSGGLCVGDNRAIARVANIDTTTVDETTLNENHVILLINRMPQHLKVMLKGYASRNLMAAIQMNANAKSNVQYDPENPWANRIAPVAGVEITLAEMISEHEQRVV